MPSNTAAWIPAKRAKLEVKPAPYTPPGDNEIVVRNHAVAVNPVDWIIQVAGYLTFSWIKYPFILGSDLAGAVVEVGQGVSRFKVGDRVLAHAVGAAPQVNKAAEGAFQTYTVVLDHMAAPIPDALPYENAAVLPLGLSTAACGLFQKDHLALQHPALDPALAPKPLGKAVLIWGGATSVGCNAIQLAVAAGYEVITTASPKNFDYVSSLGASQVFDYNSKTVVADVIKALKGKTIAGALAIGASSPSACLDVVQKCKGKKFVSMASFPIAFDRLSGGPFTTLQFIVLMAPRFLLATTALALTARLRGIRIKAIFGSSLMLNEVSRLIYVDFLPKALAAGAFVAAPRAEVVGEGLGAIQAAFEAQRKGVSAAKVVVALP